MNETHQKLLKYWKDRGFTDAQCDECMILVRDLAIEFTQYAMAKRQLETLESLERIIKVFEEISAINQSNTKPC
jgi:hypothetical protein